MALSPSSPLAGKRLLLIIGGGIAAYKCLDLIRRLKERGMTVRTILTKGGAEFVTPLAVSGLSGEKCYTDLFSLTDETEMGHIRLSREADLVLVAPATADLMAKMAAGISDNLATTALLATDKPVMIAPSMNSQMWRHAATQRNFARLQQDGIQVIAPGQGELACGEEGPGRLAEVDDMVRALEQVFTPASAPVTKAAGGPLHGKHILITAGPTHEAIDPVRYIANRSSGKQGYAIAEALRDRGARVTLVSGPTSLTPPEGITTVPVQSALDMQAACTAALPADVAICVAAVADWRVAATESQKIKKQTGDLPVLELTENPDILKMLAQADLGRPELVVGFAAETENVAAHAQAKLKRKGCDWIVANDVTARDGESVMGGDHNQVTLLTPDGAEDWNRAPKEQVAARLADKIIEYFKKS
ncbi:bifunctional phosphopantothenoylcysteine decarboxylase/phosphopantothenate--cysteine ligase CoaBC [Paremcibacter congregatus]|uniref:Coenzyme A biosynthesis bifunctional protein CoaBC n=1 Tax=Paremcibacter congregatus TaxID=2043170 RepID=A0A2G4YPC7_9PROT|nr:bifunctional phosphopantothenoylcysteine decarboxylase/phosphopantothenate--cysteine ligase CoaBC [Paremcibacter congregatus]PHZ84174.1 bifunctional phosphopantothenoylcysteine decarboxylase/phosphopantothenate--cysteine ligase CoaBC [Paremcibacter congregatus]QDE29093.1 bifunctional phosphopantothenoylcysteine decarboxylase/phosphopantothenate--cysteine ligase CoaBC [Paremcibacter congregatus]